jgi:hypothetical protein
VRKLRVLNVSDASVIAHVVMTCRRMVMLVDPKEKISLISLEVFGGTCGSTCVPSLITDLLVAKYHIMEDTDGSST